MDNEFEFWYPYYRLKEAGADVVSTGSGSSQYTGKIGMPLKIDAHEKKLSAADYDGTIIAGDYAPDYMRRHPEMIRAEPYGQATIKKENG